LSNRNIIESNTVYDNAQNGIWLGSSSNNRVINNTAYENVGQGILLNNHLPNIGSNENILTNNEVSNSGVGIGIMASSENILRYNSMDNNSLNFVATPGNDPVPSVSSLVNDVDTSNLVDGKSIYYWVNRSDQQVPSDAGCVLIVNSTAIMAKDMNLTKNGVGLLLAFSANCTVKNVNIRNNFMGIACGWCDNTLVEGSTALNNSQFGFMVTASSRSNFTGNFAFGNGYVSSQMGPGAGGFAIVNSNTTTFVDNFGENNSVGIAMTHSSASNVTHNSIRNNGNGISLQYSDDNEIINNLLLNNTEGIQLQWSHFNKVMNNSVTMSKSSGIDLTFSGGNMLKNNNLTDNKWNFGIWADALADYINDVDNSNLVNNKPILYFANQNNFTINSSMFPQVGAIVIANSTNVTVQDVTLAGNFETLTFAFTNNSRIANVTIEDSWVSIFLHDANNNTILANMLRRNIMGPTLRRSNGNMIVGNTLTDNEYCIYLFGYSSNNLLIGNNLENSNFGLYVQQSSENTIYHNNFVNNTYPCRTYISPSNAWDNGSPSGGNYWSDYIGADSNHDGIGDSNHTIDANSNDRYPLMGMFTEFDATSERHVQTVCNSTISDFHFNGTAICFNASGQNGTTGFCRICIPRVLMNSTYEVFVNGTKVQSNELICSNGTHAYLYFNYTHSTKEVIIIPEFPSFSVVPMFMSATLLAVVFFKKKQKK
jgi:parallel beta-helix repeat protein